MTRTQDERTLEEGATALLHRLAADVQVHPPLWDDLLAERAGVVVELPVGDHITERPVAPPARRYSPRVGLAAAAVIALAVAGALVLDRPTASPSIEPITIVTPADAAFDVAAAAPVWATGAADPLTATAAYLQTVGIPTDPAAGTVGSVAGVATLALQAGDDTTAVVDWTLDGATGTTGGTVYLRSTTLPVSVGVQPGAGVEAGGAAAHGWVVVGSSALDVSLDAVSYDGETLTVDIARTTDTAEQLAITTWIDGVPVSLGGEAVVDAAGTVTLGEAVDIADVAGSIASLALAVEPDDVVTLRVVRVLEGEVLSVTQMALALPDAAPGLASEIAAGVAGAAADVTAAAGAAGATADATTPPGFGGVDAGAEVEADAEVDAGAGAEVHVDADVDLPTDEILPGVTVPTLPPLPVPSIPGVPEVPLPVPTTRPQGLDLLP
jgi:hypothetical protein